MGGLPENSWSNTRSLKDCRRELLLPYDDASASNLIEEKPENDQASRNAEQPCDQIAHMNPPLPRDGHRDTKNGYPSRVTRFRVMKNGDERRLPGAMRRLAYDDLWCQPATNRQGRA
jgi:hypothetical protein